MMFEEIVDQAVEMMRRRGQVSYRMLQRQFDLDDDSLEDLKDELLFSHPVVDEAGRGLTWTGDPATPELDARRRTEAESRFHVVLSAMIALLQREGRVTYRTLEQIFVIDKPFLDDLRRELTFKQLARDEHGEGLVWTGEAYPAAPAAATALRPHVVPDATDVTSPADPALPPLVAEAATTEATRNTPEAERRQLTVMFCDLADSTKLSQQLDPEDLREVVRAYQTTAAEVIAQYEGHMAQYLGDGLLIYFGWPTAHEDDAQRALHAGLEIIEAITTTLNPRLEAEKDVQLTVRLGIHTGPVVVGEMGGGGRHENLATGETVNIAARLEGLAAANTAMISHVTARLVRDAFVLEALGPHDLKGVAEPMQVFRVDGVQEVDAEGTGSGGFEALVGRDEEIGLLLRRWQQSKEGLGQVVLISGEAGIGKSSLVEGLRQYVRQEGITRITFRCSEYVQHSPLYPVIEHLHRVLDWQREDDAETRQVKLEQVLERSSLPSDEAVPLLAALLSLPLPEGRYRALTLSPQQQRQQTQDVLVAWMLEEAERKPLLVVWEDLHWADPSTQELLGLFIDQVPTVPMLHVLVYRPAFVPPWPSQSHMTPMTLNRLERLQVEALITRLAGGKSLPAEVVAHIVAKTDGVPLYVEELTKMLLESDLLHEETDRYTLMGSLATAAIPSTLQDSLMARLDRLPTVREVAQLGAVLGREFAYEMLQALTVVEEPTLQEGLSQLVGTELLYQRGRPPRATYTFRHALIRDTAYQSLLRRTRQTFHQQVARLLEASFPEVVDTQPELVAHHYTEAACREQAIVYWQRAGQSAIEHSANQEAIAHLTKGLELIAMLPETPERAQQELDAQMALGPALMATKGQGDPDVELAYTRARALCQQVGDTPKLFPVIGGLWRFYNQRAAFQMARELGEQLLVLAQRQGDPARLLAAHQALGSTLYYMGEFTLARSHLEQGMALTDFEQQRALAVRSSVASGVNCLADVAMALWSLGYPDQALQRSQEACILARELAHPQSLAYAQYFAARLHQLRREAQVAREQAEVLMALASEQKFAQRVAGGMFMRGWALTAQGQAEEGITQMRQGITAWQATGAVLGVPHFHVLLAERYKEMGQVDEGLHVLAEAMTAVGESGQGYVEAETYRIKGELLLQQTVPDESQAESCFQQALDIARQQQAKSLELRAATSLARLWQSQSKRQDAYDMLSPVYEWFTEGFDTADLQEAKALIDELA
jgi:predicted ATPase/class 3 adenylate cyclase